MVDKNKKIKQSKYIIILLEISNVDREDIELYKIIIIIIIIMVRIIIMHNSYQSHVRDD